MLYKNKNPLVSIIIPVFNAEKYLKKCIESVINQTYQNIEVILIDDGSTDNSPLIYREYARKDNRLKINRQKNLGVSAARNNGIRMATGEYIIFIDADDWIEVNMIELMCDKLKKNKEIDICICGYKEFYEEKNESIKISLKNKISDKNFVDLILNGNNLIKGYLFNKMFRKIKIKKFFNENIKVDNMIIQSYSTTADSEHSAMSSLYPLENGMAFAQYSGNKYNDIFDLYKKSNYYTVYMHGNEGSFWNRKNVYSTLQIDDLNFIDSFDPNSELINDWVSDESLYEQATAKLKQVEKPFFSSIVASSSHTGFDLPGLANKYDKVSIDVGKYKDTYFGNYLESLNYADYAFGKFIENLKNEGLYDDTVIFIFGDHYGMQMYNEEMLNFIKESDHEFNNVETEINYANVVCGIKIPGVEHMEIKKTVSKLDIKPTLSYISSLKDEVSLGTNIFGTKDFACLNNGIVVSDDYYYNGEWYDRKNGEEINIEDLDDKKKNQLNYYKNKMDEELTISNSIVLNNLLK